MLRALGLVFALSLAVSADILHLRNGTTMEGRLLSEEGEDLPFKMAAGGQITVKRADIAWVELTDTVAAKTELARRRGAATAAGLVEAAEWALWHGMKDDAEAIWKAVLGKDPENEKAHLALGHRNWLGKWITQDEYMEKTGHVKVGGRWVTEEEKKKLDAGWEFVGEDLLSPEEAKKAKGLVEFEGKWITKKEYDEIQKKRAAGTARPANGGKPAVEPDKKRFHDAKEVGQILKVYGAGWRTWSGERYRLITNCDDKDPEFDRKFTESMDRFWGTYCDTFDKKPEQRKIHNIVVHGNQAQYDDWCRKNGAAVGVGAYGTYLHSGQFSPAVLWHRDDLRTTLYTGRHEAGHQFVAWYVRTDGGPWFQEGIAAMFEPDIPYYHYPYRWKFIRDQVIAGTEDISLTDLLKKSSSLNANQNYSRGAATHLFFFTYKDGVYRKKYQQFIAKGSIDSPDGLGKAMGKSADELDREYRQWVRDLDAIREKEGFAPIPEGPK
ncbi:MAG: hypothetical protein HUU15_10045 [Candidatus Brocadiae bacterium]|nr:hypothetical protein [Candidatus Brocadiia bacterium]